MNIRRILKNPYTLVDSLGFRGLLNWMDDATYLKLKYRGIMGHPLNLKAPKTFSEKLQWLKLYDRKPEYITMVDKCAAKDYVKNIIGGEYVIPTYGVWDSFEQIDFDSLPNQFVLKCTHDSGGLVVCRDKAALDKDAAKRKICDSLSNNYFWQSREWPYKNVKPRILAEKLMTDEQQRNGLVDYKFYCFHGEPRFLYVSYGLEDHKTAKISFLTMDWQFAPFKRNDFREFEQLPAKPSHYDQMVWAAKELAKDTPFLRVDMYEVDGKVYFSELTFSPCGGMMPMDPPQWDETIGSWLVLPQTEDKK